MQVDVESCFRGATVAGGASASSRNLRTNVPTTAWSPSPSLAL